MSEPENFLERWSRRKREATEESAPAAAPQDTNAESETEAKPNAASRPGEPNIAAADKPFDVASLPSIDSITANTDVRAFMQAGVPPDLTRAALRRAWSADPQIRDFVGLVENGWDFNDPNAMHGFGPIEPSEVARLMGNFAMTPPPAPEKTAVANEAEAQRVVASAEDDSSSEHQAEALPAQAKLSAGAVVQRSEDHGAMQKNGDEIPQRVASNSSDQK
jgi:hypothetical protein